MRVLLILVVATGALLAALLYERLFIERTFGPAAILGIAVLSLLFVALFATYFLCRRGQGRAVGNAWLAIASVAITYAFVDLAAGYLLIKPLSPPLVPDRYRHHRLVPDSYSRFEQRDFSYDQRVNHLGLRGADTTVRKPPGTIRVLNLGDSFTMGKGVEDDQTFSVRMQGLLVRGISACSGRRIEVLNGGVDSYAPILSYLQLKRDLLALEPDVVVLNLDVSDLVQEAAYRRIAVRAADGELVGVPQLEPRQVSLSERLRVWTERHLYLTRLLLYHVNRLFEYKDLSVREVVTQANLEIAAHTLEQDSVPRDQQWQDVFDSILGIKALTDSRGLGFVLSVYPWGHQVNDREWQPGRLSYMAEGAVASDRSLQRIERFAAENGVALANLFPAFRAYRGKPALYFRYDNHLTVAGHELMAQALAAFLDRRYRTEWCRSAPG